MMNSSKMKPPRDQCAVGSMPQGQGTNAPVINSHEINALGSNTLG